MARSSNERAVIKAPKELCLYSALIREETLNIISAISHLTIIMGRRLTIDFSELEVFTAAASLVVFSEITFAQISTGDDQVIEIIAPANKKMRMQFIDSGFWVAVRPGGSKKLDRLARKGCLYQSGFDPAKHLDITLETIKKHKSVPVELERAVLEATLNVMQHAYYNYESELEGIIKRWWQYCIYEPEVNEFTFMIYDKGIGIPKSINTTTNVPMNDGELIKHAMRRGVSRIKRRGRGKGSQDIRKPVEKVEEDTLFIMSHSGVYAYHSSFNEPDIEHIPNYRLPGTLVEWTISI